MAKQREMQSTHVVEWMFREKNVNLLKHETDSCLFCLTYGISFML